MQELIEAIDFKVQNHIDTKVLLVLSNLKSKALKLLEKEKEQIVDAYRIASINNAPNEDMKNVKLEYWQINAEMWYNKHYNQNK